MNPQADRQADRQTHRQAGFTLIEVLVSLMIFSTAILGLIHANALNLRTLKALEDKQIAGILADNTLLLATHSSTPLQAGQTDKTIQMNGQEWRVRLRTENTSEAGFYRLIVDVRKEDNEQVIMERTAYAPKVRPKQPVPQPGPGNTQ